MGIDLHVHSTASDGSLSPDEILTLAAQLHLQALAITDHDTIDGAVAALASGIPAGLAFISGLEISASRPAPIAGAGSFHLLGYGIRLDDPDLNRVLKKLQDARQDRNPQIIRRLNALGLNITTGEAMAETGDNGQMGRPHIATAMIKKGLVASIDEAFDRFLGTGKPAYVDKYRVACSRAIELIVRAGGIPVMAHPGLLNVPRRDVFEQLVTELKAMGLMGIEALYPEHSPEQTEYYRDVANRHRLLVTGGTDFHGAVKPETRMGSATGSFHVPYTVFENLTARLNDRPSRHKP